MAYPTPKKVPLTEEDILKYKKILSRAEPFTDEEYHKFHYDSDISEEDMLRLDSTNAKKALERGYKIIY